MDLRDIRQRVEDPRDVQLLMCPDSMEPWVTVDLKAEPIRTPIGRRARYDDHASRTRT